MGPAREEAEEVAQVGPGLDVVELAAREQGDEGGVDLRGVVAADEEPVFMSDRFAAERPLGAVVVDGEASVVQEALERDTLVEGVADGLGGGRLVEDSPGLRFAPGEESVDDGVWTRRAGPRAAPRAARRRPHARRETARR